MSSANGRGFDAFLFDFDGVLADTEPVHWKAWADALSSSTGFELTWATYQRFAIGSPDTALAALIESMGGPSAGQVMSEIFPRKSTLFLERVRTNPPILPETREMIRVLSAQRSVAVVSSSTRTEIEPVLEAARLRSCFHALVFGEDVQELKPAPEPYQKAAALLGAVRPIVFEDSEPGLASGRAAGFAVVHVGQPSELARLVGSVLDGEETAKLVS